MSIAALALVIVAGCLEISDADEPTAKDAGSDVLGTGGLSNDGWVNGDSNLDVTSDGETGTTAFQARGVVFDGLEDWLDLQSELSGVVDGYQLTGSIWFKRVGLGATYCLGPEAAGSSAPHQLEWTAANEFRIEWRKSGGGTACDLSSSPLSDTSAWHHVVFSLDTMDATRSRIYVDGQPDLAQNLVTPVSLDFTGSQWGLFADQAGELKYDGEVAELWLALNVYIDVADPAELAKFRQNGKPVDLGQSGELVTGTPPTIYLSARAGDPASVFAANRGTGGSFVTHGALELASTSPSD
jgi:hypothetical protein